MAESITLKAFRLAVDRDGVALLTWDMPNRSMNVIDLDTMADLETVIATVSADPTIKGCIVTSGKEAFSGGADLSMLHALSADVTDASSQSDDEQITRRFFENARRLSTIYRRLETCGKPFAAAIHGVCLGGAFELALSCHFRVLADDDATRVGLPEIKIGLFPGAGGTQRVARLMPTGDALQMLSKGQHLKPRAAKSMGLVHALASRQQTIDVAKEWILAGGSAVAPWDKKDFKLPSNRVHSAAGMQIWPAANAIYRRETHDNYPAARALLQAVYEGLQLPMDDALRVESRYFAHVLRSKEASAMIRSLFISMQELNKGIRRPRGIAPTSLKTVGIVGAGFMGAGIAYVSAQAGLDVILVDRTIEAAEIGKEHVHKTVSDSIAKGRAKTADRDALLGRIKPSADFGDLSECDLIVEAVFEDPKIKADVIAQLEAVVRPDCIIGSNTSTLPISLLAGASKRPEQFIGIHFFSPVEKMPLVEIIKGEKTGDTALAVALDFTRLLRKTPIVVNDSRGFFANRCVAAYLREGHLMLAEGVPPAMIENAGRMAGMPVGPLALTDEVAIDLVLKILQSTPKQDDGTIDDQRQETLLKHLVQGENRTGRKGKKGFYDYPESGPKRLWAGLKELQLFNLPADDIDFEILKKRLLFVQALEAARTFEEGVVTDPREADVGSILGFGFAPFSGGVLSFIDMMGAKTFVEQCQALETEYGPRFAPNRLLVEMAENEGSFYDPAKAA